MPEAARLARTVALARKATRSHSSLALLHFVDRMTHSAMPARLCQAGHDEEDGPKVRSAASPIGQRRILRNKIDD